MKLIAMFCGSQSGKDEIYAVHAKHTARLLVEAGYGIVYGGGNTGIMGMVANAALEAGGFVKGVIPTALQEMERCHSGLSELMVVEDMHARKKLMYESCAAAIILPGGFGTMDELFEMLTWNQLAIHDKPIFLLNSGGFYSDLFQMMQVMNRQGFLYGEPVEDIHIVSLPSLLLDRLVEIVPVGAADGV